MSSILSHKLCSRIHPPQKLFYVRACNAFASFSRFKGKCWLTDIKCRILIKARVLFIFHITLSVCMFFYNQKYGAVLETARPRSVLQGTRIKLRQDQNLWFYIRSMVRYWRPHGHVQYSGVPVSSSGKTKFCPATSAKRQLT